MTYQEKGQTKFWATKQSADRKARQLAETTDETLWVAAWEYGKGWFLEDLNA